MNIASAKLETANSSSTISNSSLISLYLNAPQEEISIDEFELYALDRLSLLRGIENLKTRGIDNKENMEKVLISLLF